MVTAVTPGALPGRVLPVTVQDLADFMNASPEPVMERQLAAAIEHVEDLCGPVGDTAWRYLVEQTPGTCTLWLPAPGIREVTALVDPAGVNVTADLTPDDIDASLASVIAPGYVAGRWRVDVITHRRSGDDKLREAILIIAKHLVEARRGQAARPAMYGGGGGGTAPTYSIPNRAQDLIDGHELVLVG